MRLTIRVRIRVSVLELQGVIDPLLTSDFIPRMLILALITIIAHHIHLRKFDKILQFVTP